MDVKLEQFSKQLSDNVITLFPTSTLIKVSYLLPYEDAFKCVSELILLVLSE
jgi:hypothetical protein